jgi:peptidoglycan hydrolase CwlO-like protein
MQEDNSKILHEYDSRAGDMKKQVADLNKTIVSLSRDLKRIKNDLDILLNRKEEKKNNLNTKLTKNIVCGLVLSECKLEVYMI